MPGESQRAAGSEITGAETEATKTAKNGGCRKKVREAELKSIPTRQLLSQPSNWLTTIC